MSNRIHIEVRAAERFRDITLNGETGVIIPLLAKYFGEQSFDKATVESWIAHGSTTIGRCTVTIRTLD